MTWKCYNKNSIRGTFIASYNDKKVLVKFAKFFGNKMQNSSNFLDRYSDKSHFFIKKISDIKIPNYTCVVCEFINSYPFHYIKCFCKGEALNYFLYQAYDLLIQMQELGIHHCDCNYYNLLISKNDFSLKLIDYDTCISDDGYLYLDNMPFVISSFEKNGFIYHDDALGIYKAFKNFAGVTDKNNILLSIKKRIGSYCVCRPKNSK